jgi:4-amino-4-deoxy-L-arabinose transferase-like glycosyltransferase
LAIISNQERSDRGPALRGAEGIARVGRLTPTFWAACGAFALTVLYRFLATASFPNDEHEYLAGAQQMLLAGEWPTRDFFDPGRPLMYVASAAAQIVFGQPLFAEALLTSLAFGVAAALLVFAAHRLSGSLLVAVIATVLTVALFPRPYAYPKVLLYVAGPLVMWEWLRRPSWPRMIAMAAFIAIAALLRHDHGVYLGGAAVATMLLAPASGYRERAARIAWFAVLVAILMLPYAIYIERSEGVLAFLRAAWGYSSREADRTQLRWSWLDWGHDVRLVYLSYLLPLAMLAWFAIDARVRGVVSQVRTPAVVVPLAALALVTNIGFLRQPLPVRVADIVVPTLCGAWLAGRALQISGTWSRRVVIGLVVSVAAFAANSVLAIGNVAENLNRTDLGRGIEYAPTVLQLRAAGLQDRFDSRYVPSGRIPALVPFFEYLDRCTTIQHRLFVAGYAPEIFTYARRLFAGGHGQFIQGYQVSEAAQRQIIERLQQQFVLFALMLSDEEPQWRAESVPIDAYVRANFSPMAEIPLDPDRTVRVLVRNGSDAIRTGTDKQTAWPCFR